MNEHKAASFIFAIVTLVAGYAASDQRPFQRGLLVGYFALMSLINAIMSLRVEKEKEP